MLRKEELDNWLKFIRKTLFDVNIAYTNMQRVSAPRDEYEESVLKNGFFHHMYFLSRFTIIIQLSKLFSTSGNQRFNINKLLEKLAEEYDDELNELLDKNKEDEDSSALLKSQEEILHEVENIKEDLKNHQELIDKLTTLRDKYYAHSDLEANLPKLTPEELKSLIDLAINIHESIWGNLMNITFLFDSNGEWKIDPLIETQVKSRKETIDKHKKLLEERNKKAGR